MKLARFKGIFVQERKNYPLVIWSAFEFSLSRKTALLMAGLLAGIFVVTLFF